MNYFGIGVKPKIKKPQICWKGELFDHFGFTNKYFANCHYCGVDEREVHLYSVNGDPVCPKCLNDEYDVVE